MWHATRDTWHVWHATRDTWHVTRDTFGGGNILSKFQLPSSYRLWFMILWRSGGKGWLNEWIYELINHKAVYRTAPATPGLVMTPYASDITFNYWSTLYLAPVFASCSSWVPSSLPPSGPGPWGSWTSPPWSCWSTACPSWRAKGGALENTSQFCHNVNGN